MSTSDQCIADLRWVVECPSFVDDPLAAPGVPLDTSVVDGDQLLRFVSERQSHRVGRYFEDLVHFWLKEVRQVEMVGDAIQVRDGKRTIGEVDFLYRDEQGELSHLEAAVKFFLHHPRDGESDFPGPNATDNFERKAAKLFEQQLRLSETHFPDVTRRVGFVKGQCFYHPGQAVIEQLPARMSSDHLRGRWLRSDQLDELSSPQGAGEVVAGLMDKPNWFAPLVEGEVSVLDDFKDRLRQHFAGPAYPVMVSLRRADDLAELERLFVVSPRWANAPDPL